MFPAIFSRTYPIRDAATVIDAMVADGYRGAQMNLSSFGLDTLPSELSEAVLQAGKRSAEERSFVFAALSGTYNMAHPDPNVRRSVRPGFLNVLSAAKSLGIPIVSLCTGSRDPANMWAHHPDNVTAAAWADFVDELGFALEAATRDGIVLAIEPEPGNVIADARLARKLLDETNSPNLKIILDAANLVGPDGLPEQAAIIAEAVDLLGSDTVLVHAKDIDVQGKVVPPGAGAIDLEGFVRRVRDAGYSGALIGHGFDAADTGGAAVALAELCDR